MLKKAEVFAVNIFKELCITSMSTGLKEDRITATNDENKAPDVFLVDHSNDTLRISPLGSKLDGFRLQDGCPALRTRLIGAM